MALLGNRRGRMAPALLLAAAGAALLFVVAPLAAAAAALVAPSMTFVPWAAAGPRAAGPASPTDFVASPASAMPSQQESTSFALPSIMVAAALGLLMSFSSALPASAIESGAGRIAEEKKKDSEMRSKAPSKEARVAKQKALMEKMKANAKIAA
eukprot:CAMPEP_0115350638 /NCGR_PEP_ID=MMETSP0270-20121206/96570_1 /TAXON_ID=71861 /ORGANISM="Scrippsiella trochoidea, Strain CCMP3099" /LENGTH=153 /DNA_ID=CAMNT_0002772739 /DNA_START=62 /DNA_END=524 /DNA_ORIENTATION=+